ncbi:MAG: ComEA family DNA-binding protein [Planctomycetota bacterium]
MANEMATDSLTKTEARQKRIQSFAFVISVAVCSMFSVGFAASSLLGLGQSLRVELDEKINPNDASIGSLVRLPGIGPGRANAIVAYRDHVSEKDANKAAFESCDDLQGVHGIGPKTAQGMSEWLKFGE